MLLSNEVMLQLDCSFCSKQERASLFLHSTFPFPITRYSEREMLLIVTKYTTKHSTNNFILNYIKKFHFDLIDGVVSVDDVNELN